MHYNNLYTSLVRLIRMNIISAVSHFSALSLQLYVPPSLYRLSEAIFSPHNSLISSRGDESLLLYVKATQGND